MKIFEESNEDDIIGYDALFESMDKCKNGVSWKDSVASFTLNAAERIMRMEDELKGGTYKMRPPVEFVVTSPKRREISSVCFKDRVYQRSINDKELYPAMTKSFIYDNWACQKGKGTDRARKRLKEFMQGFFRKHGLSGYFGKFDVKGYYPNMKHEYIEGIFQEKLKPETFVRVRDVLRNQYPGDVGYNPGSQMVQIAGISALDPLDHFIKEHLHIRYYLRYMDDFILIHESESYLKFCRDEIEEHLNKIGFSLNQQKTMIFPISEWITFLGFRYRLTDTGKVLMFADSKNVKSKRKNLRRLVAKSKRGEIPRASVDESYRSWKEHASKGDSYKLIQRMDKFYSDLWKETGSAKDNTQDSPP